MMEFLDYVSLRNVKGAQVHCSDTEVYTQN